MKEDSQLVFNVKQKITGANIHSVITILGMYVNGVIIVNITTLSKDKKEYWKKETEKYKSQLEYFVQTGKLKK